MSNPFNKALARLQALRAEVWGNGALVQLPNSALPPLPLLTLALDSDDLAPRSVLYAPDQGCALHAPANDAVKVVGQAPEQLAGALPWIEAAVPVTFSTKVDPAGLSGAVVRHRKGGVYTIVLSMGLLQFDPFILYCAHADGTMWIRPWSEFSDGRFEACDERPLTLDEMGLSEAAQEAIAA